MEKRDVSKSILVFTLVILLLVAFSGCQKRDNHILEEKEAKEESKQILELCGNNLMEAIYRCNRLDNLMLDYESVEQHTDFFDEHGNKIYSFYSYADNEIYYIADNLNCKIVYYNGQCYQYTPESNAPYVDKIKSGVTLNAYETRRNNMIFTPMGEEILLGAAQTGKEYLVTTRLPASSFSNVLKSSYKRNEFQEYVKTLEPDDNCIIEYHLTPFLYEIKHLDLYIVKGNGDRHCFLKTNVKLNGKRPEEVTDFID